MCLCSNVVGPSYLISAEYISQILLSSDMRHSFFSCGVADEQVMVGIVTLTEESGFLPPTRVRGCQRAAGRGLLCDNSKQPRLGESVWELETNTLGSES